MQKPEKQMERLEDPADNTYGRLNSTVILISLAASTGGLLFGYDLGVVGGVESFPAFQAKFFPEISDGNSTSPYCGFNSYKLELFTSTLFLAGLFATIPAGYVTKKFGRIRSMLVASLSFLLGAGFCAGAVHLAMLYTGRIFLGIGVGFGNSAVPLYLSETAPVKHRGALLQLFQLSTALGILLAQVVNISVVHVPYGWRISLGLAAIPAVVLLVASLILPKSPQWLCETDQITEARDVLRRLRYAGDQCKKNGEDTFNALIEQELDAIILATHASHKTSTIASWKKLFTSRNHIPTLILSLMCGAFQILTGIQVILFYVPLLFRAIGFSETESLSNSVVIGAIMVFSAITASLTSDRSKIGRRRLLLSGGTIMMLCNIAIASTLGVGFERFDGSLPSSWAIGVLVCICVYVYAFGVSWGPLGWTYTAEIQSADTREVGMSLAVLVNFLMSFIVGISFTSSLCALEWGVFVFYVGWLLFMTLCVAFLFPETRHHEISRVDALFSSHQFWRRFMDTPARLDV